MNLAPKWLLRIRVILGLDSIMTLNINMNIIGVLKNIMILIYLVIYSLDGRSGEVSNIYILIIQAFLGLLYEIIFSFGIQFVLHSRVTLEHIEANVGHGIIQQLSRQFLIIMCVMSNLE